MLLCTSKASCESSRFCIRVCIQYIGMFSRCRHTPESVDRRDEVYHSYLLHKTSFEFGGRLSPPLVLYCVKAIHRFLYLHSSTHIYIHSHIHTHSPMHTHTRKYVFTCGEVVCFNTIIDVV